MVVVTAGVAFAASAATASLMGRRHRDALLEHGNRVAESWEIRYDSLTGAYEERGRTVEGEKELRRQLEETNASLARRLDDQEATITSLSQTVVELRATGEVAPDTGETLPNGGGVRITPRTRIAGSRSTITLSGDLVVRPSGGYFGDLTVEADLWLQTTVARSPSGELLVYAESDLPSVRFTEVEVIDNLNDPLTKKPGLFGQLFDSGSLIVGVGAFVAGVLVSQ
jgi:hypothetical protein